jgi:Xaa-Pro aminopeptidase
MGRIKKLQKFIARQNLGVFLVTNPANIFYLTGINNFDSEKGFLLIVFKNRWKLVSSLFYQSRIEEAISKKNVVYVPRGESMSEYTVKVINGKKKIGFEREDISFAHYEIYKKALRGKKLKPITSAVEQMRQTKNEQELSFIKKAAAITDRTFAKLLKLIRPGVTELFLKRKVLEMMQDMGASDGSFDPIIASGKNSADPHYEGTNKKIRAGEMVVIDIGARYKNYCADMTRTVFVGKATPMYIKMYNTVLDIQQKALADCKIGVSTKQIYDNAVENFKKYGQDQYFTHGLGHGVGIDIHELPKLNAAGTGKLENGMVFTVEPGLYRHGWGGIRIEDLCAMQNDKCVVLSKTPKKLIEIL